MLVRIAARHDVTLGELRAANGLAPGQSLIHPGQVLIIPEFADDDARHAALAEGLQDALRRRVRTDGPNVLHHDVADVEVMHRRTPGLERPNPVHH